MANRLANKLITVSEKTVRKEGGVVILPLREYEELCERATPTYYLEGKEAEELDKLVEGGLRDYRKGRCKSIKSLSDLD